MGGPWHTPPEAEVHGRLERVPVGRQDLTGESDVPSAVFGENQPAGGNAGSGRDQYVCRSGHLIHRAAPDLACGLGDAVHSVQVRLAQLAAVGVDRKAPTHLDGAVGDELARLAASAETELLQLYQ